jgi:hypothetical protein
VVTPDHFREALPIVRPQAALLTSGVASVGTHVLTMPPRWAAQGQPSSAGLALLPLAPCLLPLLLLPLMCATYVCSQVDTHSQSWGDLAKPLPSSR